MKKDLSALQVVPPWGPIGYIVYKRTYARRLQEDRVDSPTEEFADTIRRVIESCNSQLGCGFDEIEQEELADLFMNFKGSVAGRFLWQLGTKTVDNLGLPSLQNCFTADTKFVTSEGIKSFAEFKDGDNVVIKGNLAWKSATVKNFGTQEIVEVVVKRGANSKKTIRTTLGHRWIIGNRFGKKEKIVTTSDLKPGDILQSTALRTNLHNLKMCNIGVQHGLVFGDGHYNKNAKCCAFVPCGDSAEEYRKWFFKGDDNTVEISGLPNTWKDLPSFSMNKHYIYGFLAGYFAADGSVSDTGTLTLSCSKKETLEYVKGLFSKIDVYCSDIKLSREINPFDGTPATLFKMSIYRDNLTEEFLLLNKHKERWSNYASDIFWTVESVSSANTTEDVWCIVEPEHEEFTLENGILTKNCAVTVVNQPVRPFTWAMELLMLGCGVGYNIQKEHVYQLPKLTTGKKEIYRLDTSSADFIVPDTREGWVKLLGKVLKSHFYTGQGFTYSTQLVRSKGAPIKGFGGTASGPEVLCKGIDDINKVLNKRSGKKLRPIDCLDVMNIIGSIVVAGNVRRSAQLALGDWDDLEFLKAKRWDLSQIPNWRAMSNNSIVPPENFKDLPIEFWETYNQGEPYGLINLELSRKCGRLGETQYPDPNVICYNPCAEQSLENFETCVTGDTRIQTRIGVFKIKDVVGQQVEVFNGDSWSKVTPFVAKEKDTFIKITFSDGSFLKATPYHEFSVSTPTNKKVFKKLRTDELSVGMYLPKFELPEVIGVSTDFAYTLGAFAGDGYLDAGKPTICAPETVQELLFSHCHIQSPNAMWKSDERKVTMYRAKVQPNNIPQEVWINLRNHEEGLSDYIMSLDKQSALEFLAGWIDTDGSIRNKGSEGESYAIFGCEQKIRDAQLLARRAGINFASVWKMNSKGEVTNYGTRNRDIYVLSIPTFEALSIPTKLKTITKVGDRYKVNQAHPEGSKIDTAPRQRIVAIEVLEEEEPSYCFSEPINHMGVFGNVLTYQCCLSEIYLPKINTKKELYKVAGYLYKICKHSLAISCQIKETEDIVHKNMRMGIGVTGLLQATDEQRSWLSDCYNYLRKLDKEYSAARGWPESIKLTTCKPSGCSIGSSLISTKEGLLRLDEIIDISGEEWQDVNYSTLDHKQITKGYINGFVPTRRIISEDGFVFESSLNHKYLVNNGEWKTVEELVPGDKFRVKIGGYEKTTEPEFKSIPDSNVTNTNSIIQPEKMNPDLAFFLGLFAADGSTHNKGIRISFNRRNNDLIVLLKSIIKENFGLDSGIDDDHGFYVNSVQLLRWLETNGLSKTYSSNMSVPKIVRQSSKESIVAYINGFWSGDGGQHSINSWTVCSTSKDYAQQLAVLCRLVGYNVSITNAGPGGYGKIDRNIISYRANNPTRYHSKEFKNRFTKDGYWLDSIATIEESANLTYDVSVDSDEHKYLLNGAESHNTLSLLPDVTPGIHPAPAGPYYIRRMRISAESPLLNVCVKNGYFVEYARGFNGDIDPTTMVVEFPCMVPEGTPIGDQLGAIEHLEWIKWLQTNWSDNSVSCTVYYKKEELPAIKEWLEKNFTDSLKTVSFLLYSGHGFDQAPYETISKERYEELIAKVKPITSITVDESDFDLQDCDNGACPIK